LFSQDLRDPMIWVKPEPEPEVELEVVVIEPEPEAEPEIVLKGIVYNEDKPSVIIDQKILLEGDTIHGATIIKINPNSVELERNSERWTQDL